MTEPFDEYGERLRRILHAEAETVTPSPEGLEHIRTKINKRRERRFATWLTVPWLRPLAAVAAAVVMAAGAASATPAIKTFVQTGHFSQSSRHDDGSANAHGKYTGGQEQRPGAGHPGPSDSPHPSSASPSTGTHVVSGSTCPAGEQPVGSPVPTPKPTDTGRTVPRVTCRPDTTSPEPPEQPVTPPPVSPPITQVPSSEPPTGGAQPSAQSSP